MTLVTVQSIGWATRSSSHLRYQVTGIPVQGDLPIEKVAECGFNANPEIQSFFEKNDCVDARALSASLFVILEVMFGVAFRKWVSD